MIDELYNLTLNKNRSLEIVASLRGIQKTGENMKALLCTKEKAKYNNQIIDKE